MFIERLEEKIKSEIPQDDSTSLEEKMILHDAILELKPHVVVETGTHRGLTTMYMACALAENNQGFLVTADPYEWGAYGNFAKFEETRDRIAYHQVPGKDLAYNELVGKAGIDFAFIDGYHEKAEVLAEIDALFPLLNDGAHVYFHDTNGSNIHCDVPGAIEERGLKVEYLKTTNGMAHYVHKKRKTKKPKADDNNSDHTPPIPAPDAGDAEAADV